MEIAFYISSAIAVGATAMVITRTNPVHALLYLIVSLLAIAMVFFVLGAPFVAALEIIIYAGAIMVLFIFVIMMLNLGAEAERRESAWLSPQAWAGPSALTLVLLVELVLVLAQGDAQRMGANVIEPKQVSLTLFGPYLLGVELASVLLLSALVGAYHLGRPADRTPKEGEL